MERNAVTFVPSVIFKIYPDHNVYSHRRLNEITIQCYCSLPFVLDFPPVFIFSVFFAELIGFCDATFDDRLDFLLMIEGRGATLDGETSLTFLVTSASSAGAIVSGSTSTEVLTLGADRCSVGAFVTLLLDAVRSFLTESANELSSLIGVTSRIGSLTSTSNSSLTSTSNSVKNMQYICGAFLKLLCNMQEINDDCNSMKL